MLLNIFLIAAMATLAASDLQPLILPNDTITLPQIPTFVHEQKGDKPNFKLVTYEPKDNHFTSCWMNDLPSTPREPNITWQSEMMGCLNQYNVYNWDGQVCGGVGWFKAKLGNYENPQNCWNACQGCINWFINSSSTDGYCWTVHAPIEPNWNGGAPYSVHKKTACDLGYHLSG
ncbi:MAG: hypothetical protein Q9168_006196 [Polycauliona sp. 1 TL-2023]